MTIATSRRRDDQYRRDAAKPIRIVQPLRRVVNRSFRIDLLECGHQTSGRRVRPARHRCHLCPLTIAPSDRKRAARLMNTTPERVKTWDELTEGQKNSARNLFSATMFIGKDFADYIYELNTDGRVLSRRGVGISL